MTLIRRDWHNQALCANEDSEFWFYESPKGGGLSIEIQKRIKVAKQICSDCSVKLKCLEQGMEAENLIQGTIWGGLTLWDRQRLIDKAG
jgi:hypothetical protein